MARGEGVKHAVFSLSLLVLCLAAVPAVAQGTIYDNGPIDRTTDAWTINFGFVVSGTFVVPSGGASVDGWPNSHSG